MNSYEVIGSISAHTSYYFLFHVSNNYKKFEIETKSTADNDPNYKIDLKNFIKTSSDIELANIDSS